VAAERFSLVEESPEEYFVQVRAANAGNVEISAVAEARLIGTGDHEIKSIEMQAAPAPMLPMQKRSFGGKLSIGDVSSGPYTLRVVFEHEGEAVGTDELSLVVESDASGEKTVRVIDEAHAD
jgi:hypothetical protein